MRRIHHADNLTVLRGLADGAADLVYIDPPFNTGRTRRRKLLRTIPVEGGEPGDRTGFHGLRYRTEILARTQFLDRFDDYLAWLEPRLREAYRVLAPHGTLYFHIDYREVHYCKVLLDGIFGRESFLNEIVWAYDFGGRPRDRWAPKHDNILVYVKDPGRYTFDYDAIERIPYMAPRLVGARKAAEGKRVTDTWWHTIVPTNSREKTGYATQKPLGILRRIISVSSRPGDLVLDFFAGSGTTGAACLELGRSFLLVDDSAAAITAMRRRFAGVEGIEWVLPPRRRTRKEA